MPGGRVVGEMAVELDGHLVLEPDRIDQASVTHDVQIRWGEGVAFAEEDESLFERLLVLASSGR